MTDDSGARPLARGAALAKQIFPGNGEMATLICGTDWSATPLGALETWPQSLRTAVSICLGSRHPIVLWWGPERWMFYNDGYRPMLGEVKHPQFLGRPGEECWSEIWDIIGPMMEQVIETGEATWSENLFLQMRRSGYLEETYFTFSYSPIRDEAGRPSGIFNACTETTARVLGDRRMKMLRQMAVEARTVSEAAARCLEIISENARDIPFAAVYLLEDDGEQFQLSAQVGLTGGTAATPLTVSATASDNASDASGGGWPLAQVLARGAPQLIQDLDRRFDCLPSEPWDEPAHQAMLLPIARPGHNQPSGMLVLGISPRRAFDDDYRGFFELVVAHLTTAISNARAYEEASERAERLAEIDRVKTAFFSNVSHEFRTPLTLMLGPLEDALAAPDKTLGGETLEALYRNAVRLLRLVNSLLDFSRVEAGRAHSRFEPTDLAVLTGGLAGSFQSLVESAGLHLSIDCPALSEPVYVDRSQWEKIVLNLISNAFKFTFAGEISVRLRTTDSHVELVVKDTGIGIPSDDLPKLFTRFHRVEGARGRSFEGTGIGLALVLELVKQHGGTVHVESSVGVGSSFCVSIPKGVDHLPKDRVLPQSDVLAEVTSATPFVLEAAHWNATTPSAELDQPVALSAAAARSESWPPFAADIRVLVADDNADMRAYLVRLLSARWTVAAVEDGVAALASARKSPPDLVLSDVMMPHMNGLELLRELRKDPHTRDIPFILLSARAGEEDSIEGLQGGADDYLAKPFSARELLARVRTHIELSRVRRKSAEDLARANKELEAFSYSVSHDLRAPLRVIDGFSRALLADYQDKLDAQGVHYLQRVRATAQRMASLIDDMLNLSRINRSTLQREPLDVTELAESIFEELRKRDPERKVSAHVEPGLHTAADPRLLRIAFENLLSNAWKFTGKTANAEISVGRDQHDGADTFFIRDNGAGFDMAYAARLFAPFQRLHKTSDFEGTGIGLAIVERVVSKHDGRIWATGVPSEGAAFYFTLGEAQQRKR